MQKAVSTLFVGRALPAAAPTRSVWTFTPAASDTAGSARPTSSTSSRWRNYRMVLSIVGFAIAATTTFAATVPTYDALRAAYVPSDRIIVDRNGAPLQRIRVDDKVRRAAWTTLDQISPALIDAVLASEDKRFFEHGGVDLRAAASAALGNLRAGSAQRGASSISMQVAAMLDTALTRASDGRSLGQKLDQVQAAWTLERSWTKAQILETYLNTVFFRGEIQGIGAAAEQLFGKAAHGLNATESALLAALIRAPQAPRAVVERRACDVLKGLDARADCSALAYAIDRWGSASKLRDDGEFIAPHIARYLPKSAERAQASTLDRNLQLAARDAIAKHLQQLGGRNAHDAAVVAIDNATGEVLAYIGSSGRLSAAGEVDAARAPRQAGSTLKPFIYGLGIEKNLFTAATLLDDAPFSVDAGGGAYTPQNYAHEYVGPVSVRTALAASLNVPAIRALTLVGVAPSHALLKRAGLTTLNDDPEHYGFSLALGSADVSLIELTNAYRAIANGGSVSAPRFVASAARAAPTAPTARLFSDATAWIVTDMLADRGARYVTFGFDNPLALSHWAAVKTGTSKDMRDNWTIGFNARVTIGVWVGNASGESMHNVTGISGAGPIWADVMEVAAARFGAGRERPAPSNVIKRRVQFANENGRTEASRDEWFVRGTEPSTATQTWIAAREGNAAGARIVTPADGTIIALDPDIPATRQRITLTSGDSAQAACWEVNGEALGCNADAVSWQPTQGNFVVRLLDKSGEERDRISIIVRGNKKSWGAFSTHPN